MKALATLTFAGLLLPFSSVAEPLPYRAIYEAKALGMTAEASRTQTRSPEGVFVLENRLSLTILGANVGTAVETSEFTVNGNSVIAQHYHYDQTGISSSQETIDFDWSAQKAQSRSDDGSWSFDLSPGVLDKLSYSVQLSMDLRESSTSPFRFQVLDEDEIKQHDYQILGEEELHTGVGKLKTVKIERVRDDDSQRRTTVWLAPEWDFLLIRLEQVSRNGTSTELQLESAIVDGRSVAGH